MACSTTGLRYCGIRVTDLDRSLAFYTGAMGLKELRRGRASHGGTWVLLVDPRTRQRLKLDCYPPGSPFVTPYVPGDGLDHLGFHASSPEALVRRLRAAGAKPVLGPGQPTGVPGIHYFLDLDGNWIEVY